MPEAQDMDNRDEVQGIVQGSVYGSHIHTGPMDRAYLYQARVSCPALAAGGRVHL